MAEQDAIVSALATANVAVNAVAGSGKTTTISKVAARYHNRNILVLTYNTRLRAETTVRLREMSNVEVHTFHSYATVLHGAWRTIANDDLMDQALQRPIDCRSALQWDTLILDEVQDCTPLYHEFVLRIVKERAPLPHNFRMLIMGDSRQLLYDGKANVSYLEQPAQHWAVANQAPWIHMPLTTTYRLPASMCTFLNKAVMKSKHFKPARQGGRLPEDIVIHNLFNDADHIVDFIDSLVSPETQPPYGYDDIMVLAFNVHRKSKEDPFLPIHVLERRIVNRLGGKGCNIVGVIREASLTKDVLRGKLLISSVHAAKGLERKVVIVYGYSEPYDRWAKSTYVSNVHYVALTRASERLIIVRKPDLILPRYIRMSVYQDESIVAQTRLPHQKDLIVDRFGGIETEESSRPQSVTQWVGHLPRDAVKRLLVHASIETVRAYTTPASCLRFPSTVDLKCTTEEVGRYSGYITESVAEHLLDAQKEGNISDIKELLHRAILKTKEWSYEPVQIKLDELSKGVRLQLWRWRIQLIDRLQAWVKAESLASAGWKFQGKCSADVGLKGEYDGWDPVAGHMLELKHVSSGLVDAHRAQLLLYMWMTECKKGILYNACTDELELLSLSSPEELSSTIKLFIDR